MSYPHQNLNDNERRVHQRGAFSRDINHSFLKPHVADLQMVSPILSGLSVGMILHFLLVGIPKTDYGYIMCQQEGEEFQGFLLEEEGKEGRNVVRPLVYQIGTAVITEALTSEKVRATMVFTHHGDGLKNVEERWHDRFLPFRNGAEVSLEAAQGKTPLETGFMLDTTTSF